MSWLIGPTLPSAGPRRISASTYRWYVTGLPGYLPAVGVPAVEVPIVGRDQELAQVRAALVAASAGGGRLVLVSGEPGIGKTRLTTAIVEMAGEYDVPVASGYAIDDPGMPPLWPWRRVARTVPALGDVLGVAADSGAAADAGGAVDAGAAADSAAARFAMFTEASQALADAAANGGLLVVLEDLQWADRTSLLLLRHLAGELARTRLLVVGTFRATADAPLADLLPDLLRTGGTRAIRLAGLSSRDIAQWLRQLAADGDAVPPTAGTAGRLAERTGGNPLFVRMIVERGVAGIDHGLAGYPELRQLVLGRLSPSGDPVRDLLDAASVLGERIDPPLLASVAGLPAAGIGDLLDQAVARGVLRAVPDTAGLAFAHALVRDAVYGELPPSRRMTLHERAARALEQASPGAAAGPIAGHWRRSGAPGWSAHCVRWARAAACSAAAALAYDEAAQFAVLALEAAEAGTAEAGLRAELTLDAAQAEFAAGHIEASVARCQVAARLAEEAGRPDLLAAAALVITGMGDVPTIAAVDALCASAVRAVPVSDVVLRARLLAELWSHVWLVDAAFQAGDLAAVDYELGRIEQLAIAGRHGLAWWHLHRLRASRAALTGELDAALAYNEQAREVAVRIGATSTTGMYYAFLGQIALLRGTIDRELAEATIRMLRQVPEIPLVRIFLPMAYALLGERDLARATFEEFRYMPGTVEVGPRWAALLVQIGTIAAWLGDAETAERVYQEFAGLAPGYMGDGSGAVFCGGSMQRLIGDFALAAGRAEEAVRRYTDAIEMNARIGARPFLALSRLGLARALVAGAGPGELARARALVIDAAAEF